MKITVIATTTFEGFHRWPAAPPQVEFLASMHRHKFHVRAEVAVSHADRDLEFITLGRRLAELCESLRLTKQVENWSCETWAVNLIEMLDLCACEVWEDGENGARVER